MVYVLFLVGFVLLIKGADFLVEGSSSIAKKYHIPELIIGLTIVSFGTSMPELVVNILASFNGSSELAIGNIFGSNIANVLLILGVSAIIKPLPIQRSIYFTEIPLSLLATFMVGFLANANLFSSEDQLMLSRFDGGMLLFFFALFMGYIYVVSRSKQTSPSAQESEEIILLPMKKSILYILLGMVGLFLGGKWVVDGAIHIAEIFELSETLVGLTVVAIGTSLPELVTSAVAAYKNKADLAVGNAIGSNIFNLLWILGLSAVIQPLPFSVITNMDILMVIFASSLLIMAVIVGTKPRVDRWEGWVFLVVYLGYTFYLILRG